MKMGVKENPFRSVKSFKNHGYFWPSGPVCNSTKGVVISNGNLETFISLLVKIWADFLKSVFGLFLEMLNQGPFQPFYTSIHNSTIHKREWPKSLLVTRPSSVSCVCQLECPKFLNILKNHSNAKWRDHQIIFQPDF